MRGDAAGWADHTTDVQLHKSAGVSLRSGRSLIKAHLHETDAKHLEKNESIANNINDLGTVIPITNHHQKPPLKTTLQPQVTDRHQLAVWLKMAGRQKHPKSRGILSCKINTLAPQKPPEKHSKKHQLQRGCGVAPIQTPIRRNPRITNQKYRQS